MPNELTGIAYISIAEGVVIAVVAWFLDALAPMFGMHHSPTMGRFQICLLIYGVVKVLWGMYICKHWGN